jgi:hypothetical protein
MRITAAQRTENENRIRAAMDRLLRGEIPPGCRCDIKTLAIEASVDRTAFYGTRPYPTSAKSSNAASKPCNRPERSPPHERPRSHA